VAAPAIIDATLKVGFSQQQGTWLVAGIFGGLAAIPFLLIFSVVVNVYGAADRPQETVTFTETVRTAWANVPFPFRHADLHAELDQPLTWWRWCCHSTCCNWDRPRGYACFCLPAGCFPPAGISRFPPWLLVTATGPYPFGCGCRTGWASTPLISFGMVFWRVCRLYIPGSPGQIPLVLWMAFLAGLSVSAAHILPDAMFPDVIEWDELRTGRRQEGIYYGVKNFIRKLTVPSPFFIALQALGWFGLPDPPAGATSFMQSPSALMAIRIPDRPVRRAVLLSQRLSPPGSIRSRVPAHARIPKTSPLAQRASPETEGLIRGFLHRLYLTCQTDIGHINLPGMDQICLVLLDCP